MDKLIIANWKMNLSHNEALDWLSLHFPEVRQVVDHTEHELIICPSFTELPYALDSYPDYYWGAQDCASISLGAYTGDISAVSLNEMGVSFTIVGHSERRKYYGESNEDVRNKVALLLEQEIHPIICIGETELQRSIKHEILKEQVSAVLDLFTENDTAIIAYEPVWAIGTGITPSEEELSETMTFLRTMTEGLAPHLLYGGSVNPSIAQAFSPHVDGFLIGSASCDADVLKKIILSC